MSAIDKVGQSNLDHAVANDCSDPDCEIHNPDVAYLEEVIGKTELAFWIAGYYAGGAYVADQAGDSIHNIHDELMGQGIIPPPEETNDD